MPQMAPINWLFLYCFFMVIFMMFNFLNYYLFLYNKKFNYCIKKINTIKMNWKW